VDVEKKRINWNQPNLYIRLPRLFLNYKHNSKRKHMMVLHFELGILLSSIAEL